MTKDAKIYIAGHNGLVGSAILRRLQNEGFENLVLKTFDQLDLRDQHAVKSFLESERPEYAFLIYIWC